MVRVFSRGFVTGIEIEHKREALVVVSEFVVVVAEIIVDRRRVTSPW